MGDIADWCIDAHMDAYGDSPYGSGSSSRSVTCKRCGKSGLHWDDDGDGNWVLMETATRIHRCDMQKAAVDDFEVVQ